MTEPSSEVQCDAVTRVARDLRECERLASALAEEAADDSNARLMPGGKAMVLLGPHANLEAWENRQESTERTGKPYTVAGDEDPEDYWDSLQLLLFWSEQTRRELGEEYGLAATLVGEAAYLRHRLEHLWDNEPAFDDFAADVRKARTRLEDVLHDGRRTERGVPCFDCNVDLVRPTKDRREVRNCEGHDGVCAIPHDHCPHDRGGLADEWICPQCERRYDVEAYRRAVSHAHFVHAAYLTLADCIERTGVPRGSIQGWATRGHVRRQKDQSTGRVTYCVADIETQASGDVA